MKILAIEFSSEQRSVALVEGPGGAVCETLGKASERSLRTSRAFDLIERVLSQARIEREEIECLVVGLGPGSYTGIRAAIALAQGWQLARGTKLLGISSVECLAWQAHEKGWRGQVSVAVDAQRTEFYLASYAVEESGIQVIEPLHLASGIKVGNRVEAGFQLIGPEVTQWFEGGRIVFPEAAMLGRLACGREDFVAGQELEPIYLRETSFVKAPAPRVIP